MSLPKFASAHAHRLLSKLLDAGIVPTEECTATARCEEHGVQVVVILAPYVRAEMADPPTKNTVSYNPSVPSTTVSLSTSPLREIDRNIWETASETPISGKKLIVLAGYKSNSYSRGSIRRLVDAGYLAHITGGYRRGNVPLPS